MKYIKAEDEVIFLVILCMVVIGFVVGYMTRSCESKNETPIETSPNIDPIFSDDSRAAEIFFAINDERGKAGLPLLINDTDLVLSAYADAIAFTFDDTEAIYLSRSEEVRGETVLKVWLDSEYKEKFILNEKIEKIGVITYYEETTKERVYVAKFE